MLTPCYTTIQSLTTCSKKVTDMILYAVSKEMAKKLLSTPPEEYQKNALANSHTQKQLTKRNKKMLAL